MTGVVFLGMRVLSAAVLYLFLGWMIWIIWQDIKKQGISLASPQVPVVYLITRIDSIKRGQKFYSKEIIIGRDPICDLHLEDGAISARHARMIYRQNQWWIEDLDSRNGTRLNKNSITTPVVLTTGDRIQCGQIEVEVRLGKDAVNGSDDEN